MNKQTNKQTNIIRIGNLTIGGHFTLTTSTGPYLVGGNLNLNGKKKTKILNLQTSI